MIDRFIEIKRELTSKDGLNSTEGARIIALEILKLEQQQKIWDQQKKAINDWIMGKDDL